MKNSGGDFEFRTGTHSPAARDNDLPDLGGDKLAHRYVYLLYLGDQQTAAQPPDDADGACEKGTQPFDD